MRLGRRVLGAKEFNRQQREYAEAKARAFMYGPRVTGSKPKAKGKAKQPETAKASKGGPANEPTVPTGQEGAASETAPVGDAAIPVPATTRQPAPGRDPVHIVSVEQLGQVLKGEPSEQLLDELIDSEFQRPEGEPRRGALRLLLRAEQDRGDAARPAIVKELQRALEANG